MGPLAKNEESAPFEATISGSFPVFVVTRALLYRLLELNDESQPWMDDR